MNISDLNNKDQFHARNLGWVEITECITSPVEICVMAGEESRKVTLMPYLGKLRLRLSDILKGFDVAGSMNLQSVLQCDAPVSLPLVNLRISAGNQSLSRYIMDGGIGGDTPSIHWLTWRGLATLTYQGAREYLGFAVPSEADSCKICFRVYYMGGTQRFENEVVCDSETPCLIALPVSYDIVKELADDCIDEIIAYDVWAEIGGTILPTRRYIVKCWPQNAKCYIFRNTLGFYDTIYASGQIKSQLDGESHAFKCRDEESEISNDSVEHLVVNSGHISTERDRALWLDFLSSPERYELSRSGTIKKIIVTEYDAKPEHHALSSVSFTYHIGKKPEGRYFIDQPIKPFDYDLSEF